MRATTTRLTAMVALLVAAAVAVETRAGLVPSVGILAPLPIEPSAPLVAAFRQGLREFGYTEGQNVAVEIRSANGRLERLPGLAAELVRLKVNVILAVSNPAIAAAQMATQAIPIVMTIASDPVASGFVAGLGRPGGNTTGLTIQAPDVAGKALHLLKEAIPGLSQVAVLWDPAYPGARQELSEAQAAAPVLGIQLHRVEVHGPGGLDGALAAVTSTRASAAFILGSPILALHRVRIAEFALRHRLPTMCTLREYLQAGCLLAYGTSFADQYTRAAYFVDRILKGAKPADLPVEQPTKFYFGVNLKTAKVLGLTLPLQLVLQAGDLIE